MKKAFTLAEVLITLGIIGIVAAMTMPTLIQKQQDVSTISQLKKSYSMLNQAWISLHNEYGPIKDWSLEHDKGMEDILIERFSKYIKMSKICKIGERGCFPDVNYKAINGTSYGNWETSGVNKAKAKLSDGTLFMVNVTQNPEDGVVVQFYIDVNGWKKPNQLGHDFFYFYLWDDNFLRPAGWKRDGEEMQTYFEENCMNNRGYACAHWAIYQGNRDYLKCKDLSYKSKTKCK